MIKLKKHGHMECRPVVFIKEIIQDKNVRNLLSEFDFWRYLSLKILGLKYGPHSIITDLGESSLIVREKNGPGLNVLHSQWNRKLRIHLAVHLKSKNPTQAQKQNFRWGVSHYYYILTTNHAWNMSTDPSLGSSLVPKNQLSTLSSMIIVQANPSSS